MMKAIALLAGILPLFASAQAPQKLGYQGRLLDASGAPVNGVVAMKFELFDLATAGASTGWSETQSVAVADGYYAVVLGDTTPVPSSALGGPDRFLEITAGGSVLSPRQRVESVPYAISAMNVGGGTVDATSIAVNGSPVVNGSGKWVGASVFPACANNQVLQFTGGAWGCATLSA